MSSEIEKLISKYVKIIKYDIEEVSSDLLEERLRVRLRDIIIETLISE